MSDKLCNMCGESLCPNLMGEEDTSEYGLVDAKVEGGYYSPALSDCSIYKFSFCEYCLDHIFQQCVKPPQGWDYYYSNYQPIEDSLNDYKYVHGKLYEYQGKTLEEKHRRDAIRRNVQPYKPTSKELLEYKKVNSKFGNSESAPTKAYQNLMKSIRDEMIEKFSLLSEEEKAEKIRINSTMTEWKKEILPPEQWWDHHVPSDEDIVSQETHDTYKSFCDFVDSESMKIDYLNDVEYENKKILMKEKIKLVYDSFSDEAKRISKSLYNLVMEIKDPAEEEFYKKFRESLPKDEIVILTPRNYPDE